MIFKGKIPKSPSRIPQGTRGHPRSWFFEGDDRFLKDDCQVTRLATPDPRNLPEASGGHRGTGTQACYAVY